MPMRPRPWPAVRPTRSPMPGGARGPGSRVSTPTWRRPPRACYCPVQPQARRRGGSRSRRRSPRGVSRPARPERGPPGGRDRRAPRGWLADGDRRLIVDRQDQLAPGAARPHRILAGARSPAIPAGAGSRLTVRQRGLGAPLRERVSRPCGPAGRARAGSRVLADLVELTGDLTDATTATAHAARPRHRAHRAHRLRGQPGPRAPGRHAPSASQRGAGPPLGESRPTGATRCSFSCAACCSKSASTRSGRPACAPSAPTRGCSRSATTCTACSTTPSSTTRFENLIPATYDIEDPGFSTNITEDDGRRVGRADEPDDFIEPALHNDSSIGDPPTAIHGTGLYDHVRNAAKNLGFPVYTRGATRAATCTPRRSTRWTTSTRTTSASSARARSATTT